MKPEDSQPISVVRRQQNRFLTGYTGFTGLEVGRMKNSLNPVHPVHPVRGRCFLVFKYPVPLKFFELIESTADSVTDPDAEGSMKPEDSQPISVVRRQQNRVFDRIHRIYRIGSWTNEEFIQSCHLVPSLSEEDAFLVFKCPVPLKFFELIESMPIPLPTPTPRGV